MDDLRALEQPSDDIGSSDSVSSMAAIGGLVEVYGRQEAGECWILAGWISRSWMLDQARGVTGVFDRGAVSGNALVAFYERADLGALGIGFIILVPSTQRRLGKLKLLQLALNGEAATISPAADARELQGKALVERAEAILAVCLEQENLDQIRALAARRFVGEGYLDAYGYHAPAIGWFFCGWVSVDWVAHAAEPGDVTAHFEGGSITGAAILNFFDREDIRGKGLGFVLHLANTTTDLGRLLLLSLRAGNAVVILRPSVTLERCAGETSGQNFLSLIIGSDHGPARDKLRELASRAAHDGRDTVNELKQRLFIEFDEAIACPPDGIVLFGWMLARPGAIKSMRLRAGAQTYPVDLDSGLIWIDRNDVIETLGREHGFDDPRCGFVLRIPTPKPPAETPHLEIETDAGELAFKSLPRPKLDGVGAMKRMLGGIDTQYTDVDTIYDHVLGPAISALNTARLAAPPRVQPLHLGPRPEAPKHSVIIPLYGRIDFMEMQLALFATLGIGADVEIIYVLDDPPKTRAAQFLAASLYERFRVPFTLLCLSRNMGFAPANNIGLHASSGCFICFMNSDVFPTTGDWLDRLATHIEDDPTIGVVGPVLLFEDGSVQHQGIFFKTLPQFGSWQFAHHLRKGFRVPDETGLVRQIAITGACMLLRRESAIKAGGFDESYIIGDFEDTDLCFKLMHVGQSAAVDFGVRMYHLERKSQAASSNAWRTNLTLYNAWVHQRRWGAMIGRLEAIA